MPLLDHFHPPLSQRRHWEGFHARWASALTDLLNENLPEDYFAEPQIHPNQRVEVDIGAFDERNSSSGGVATMPRAKSKLISADLIVPAEFPPEFEIRIFETSGGPRLVAAIELVSPANKDREETRLAFAVKCASLLQAGCGVLVMDIVTSRGSLPMAQLLSVLASGQPIPEHGPLSAVSYRPTRDTSGGAIEIRYRTLHLGETLPSLPLAFDAGQTIEIDFEYCYEEARTRSRL
jgi:hypothetical protein